MNRSHTPEFCSKAARENQVRIESNARLERQDRMDAEQTARIGKPARAGRTGRPDSDTPSGRLFPDAEKPAGAGSFACLTLPVAVTSWLFSLQRPSLLPSSLEPSWLLLSLPEP